MKPSEFYDQDRLRQQPWCPWDWPFRMRPPTLDEAVQDETVNAGRGPQGWGRQRWTRPSRMRPLMLDNEAIIIRSSMLDEATLDEVTNAGRGHKRWMRPSRLRPPILKEALGWGRQCWTRPPWMRLPKLDEAVLDEVHDWRSGNTALSSVYWSAGVVRFSRNFPRFLLE